MRPTFSELTASNLSITNAALFGCSSAFLCKTKSSTQAGNTVSLWNGADQDDSGWGNGEAWVTPDPIMPSDATYTNIACSLTRVWIAGLDAIASTDHWYLEALGGSNNYTTTLKFKWLDGAGAALNKQVWFTVIIFSPRRALNTSTYTTGADISKQALYGGIPSNPSSVFPQ